MEFKKTDFEQLNMSKITDSMYEGIACSRFFFCLEDKIVFINKSKTCYNILASSQCNFEFKYQERIFDVIYSSKNINECISYFKFLCDLIIRRY